VAHDVVVHRRTRGKTTATCEPVFGGVRASGGRVGVIFGHRVPARYGGFTP
jgi:hypothetical protein